MEKNSKIFVAGHRGLVGSAILNNLRNKGYHNFVLRTHAELDLTDQSAVYRFLKKKNLNMFFWPQLMWVELWQIVGIGLILFIRI